MTVYKCQNNKDRNLVHESLNPLLKIIFGNNHIKENNDFIELFDQKVKKITINRPIDSRLSTGKCHKDNNEEYYIEITGYPQINEIRAKKNAIKTFLEIFTDLIPTLEEQSPSEDDILKSTTMGLIKNENDNQLYGNFFHEMAMEIIANIAINQSLSSNTSIKDILTKIPSEWECDDTINSTFINIIQLTIAAFSNNPNINYDELSDLNLSIFNTNTTLKDNDFLYGIIWNPLHIEKEFDKYMGKGFYKTFCDCIDTIYYDKLTEKKGIPKKKKILIINILSSFMNLRINDYVRSNIITEEEAIKIRNNFRKIRDNNHTKKETKPLQKIKK